MTLLQLTEPLFQYICRLNRIARRGAAPKPGGETTTFGDTAFITRPPPGAPAGPQAAAASARVMNLDYSVARSEIKALFEDMMSKATSDSRLSQQARKMELPLIFFVDSMISESNLPFAGQWNQNRLAYDRQELAGDEKFFDLLDETLKDSSEDAVERLSDDGPIWPDESAETAFLSEQQGPSVGISLPVTAPVASEDEGDREDAAIPLPSLDDLINRVPAHTREVLEDLFRARFVRVVRTKKHLLK